MGIKLPDSSIDKKSIVIHTLADPRVFFIINF
jgi:hypothetical protein